MENKLHSLTKTVRLAGLLDLIWIITGIYAMFYIPSQINTRGDVGIAAQNILSNELLFRTGIINGLISNALWLLLVLIFYQLFKSVNRSQAKLMVALVIVQIPISFIMEAFNISSLMILKGKILKTFNLIERQELAILFQRINDYLVLSLELFWGLWLFPLGILVYRSLFLPRFLGIWLIINGIGYVALSFTSLLFPLYKDLVFKISFPAMLGELAFMLWLLIKGAKNNTPTI